MPFAASPRCELGSSRGQPRAKVSPLTPRCSLCTHTSEPRMVVPRATTTSPGTWERATRPAPTAWGTHGSSQLAGCRCGCRRVGNCLETAPPAVARCCRPMLVLPGTPLGRWWPETCPSGPLPADPPCSPPPPFPALCFPRDFPAPALPASRREPQKTRRTGSARPRPAPERRRIGAARSRHCACAQCGQPESHATPPPERLPPLGSDTTRAVGNFLSLARTRSPTHPAGGWACALHRAEPGPRQVFVPCGSRDAEGRVRQAPARRGGAGRWARGGERRAEAAPAHSRTRRGGFLSPSRAWYFPEM